MRERERHEIPVSTTDKKEGGLVETDFKAVAVAASKDKDVCSKLVHSVPQVVSKSAEILPNVNAKLSNRHSKLGTI